jgi:hypothetical protein
MKSLFVMFITISCACPSVSAPRNGVATSQTALVAMPSVTAAVNNAPPEPVEPAEVADAIAAPERYLGRLIKVRGRASVCPDLCNEIKIRCGLVSPARGPCYGYGALSSDESSEIEGRCSGGSNGPQNALLLDVDDARFACRGHCGKWECPTVEPGRRYEATARLRTVMLVEATRYELVPVELKELAAEEVTTGQGD